MREGADDDKSVTAALKQSLYNYRKRLCEAHEELSVMIGDVHTAINRLNALCHRAKVDVWNPEFGKLCDDDGEISVVVCMGNQSEQEIRVRSLYADILAATVGPNGTDEVFRAPENAGELEPKIEKIVADLQGWPTEAFGEPYHRAKRVLDVLRDRNTRLSRTLVVKVMDEEGRGSAYYEGRNDDYYRIVRQVMEFAWVAAWHCKSKNNLAVKPGKYVREQVLGLGESSSQEYRRLLGENYDDEGKSRYRVPNNGLWRGSFWKDTSQYDTANAYALERSANGRGQSALTQVERILCRRYAKEELKWDNEDCYPEWMKEEWMKE